jgi:hypothetical protein
MNNTHNRLFCGDRRENDRKMDRMRYLIPITFVLVMGSLFLLYGYFNYKKGYDDCLAVHNNLPSIQDIQKQIGVKPDGILGKTTQEAWEKAYCEQEGNRAYRRFIK